MAVETERKLNKFGLEVTDGVIWQGGWHPGGEYTKNITLRNIDLKTKKLKYRIPCSRFFTTRNSNRIVLGSGTTISLPITFKPLDQNVYEENIIFETKNGKFSIPIKAISPEADLVLPASLDFGPCAVGDQMQKTFEIRNECDLEVSFHLNSANPFLLTPDSGFLVPKSRCLITVEYKPEAAHVYQVDAICDFASTSSKRSVRKIPLLGIGKFTHLSVRYGKQKGRNIDIDFGNSDLHTENVQSVELINYSPVTAPFQVLQPLFDVSVDKVFKCAVNHGRVPANGSIRLNISYTPNICDISQADSFEILALGATTCAIVRCIGRGKGPYADFDTSSVNFGRTKVEGVVQRAFSIMNHSQLDAIFQFMIDCSHSCFQFDVKCGKLRGGSSKTIKITFKPEKPINYYRRVTCLFHNQDPIYLDLFGTCYSEQISPAFMDKHHLDRYQLHVARGLSRFPPEDLSSLLRENKIRIDDQNCLEVVEETLNYDLYKPNVNCSAVEEYFSDRTAEEKTTFVPHVSVDFEHVEFSRCNHGHVYHKTINVTNHTKGIVTCIWNSGIKGSPFCVMPEELDILPLRSASFSIKFKPIGQGQFYAVELEGYVFYKSIRDHRLFEDICFCPPWCVTVAVSGHTFSHKDETFFPEFQLNTNKLVFPPVVLNQSTYKTLLLTNNGKNPIFFSLHSEEERIITCKPSRGLLRDKYQILVLRFTPEFPGSFTTNITCRLNASDKFYKEIQLIGSAEIPELQINPQETIYFKKTCIGTTSNRNITLKNPRRISLRFEWQIPSKDRLLLSVDPPCGFISPNELQVHKWSFTPGSVSANFFKVNLKAWIDGHVETQNKQMLRLFGEGATGSISCIPKGLDFGDVVVGSLMQKTVHLRNESDCGLYFDLYVDHESHEAVHDDQKNLVILDIQLSELHGYLPAKSQKPLTIKLIPEARSRQQCYIKCRPLPVSRQGNEIADEYDKSCLCSVLVRGVYPTFSVSDIRGSGCAQRFSMTRLWNLFSIDRFNMYLDADPCSKELLYAAATRHSTRRRMPVRTRAVIDFNFGSAPHLSDSCQINIYLKNTGSASADWTFLLPTDLQLELEFWAQTGDFDADELHEMYVMDNSLFGIEPTKGTLASGESQVIRLTYSHSSVGIHKLPVLFKVTKGREVLLNFVGHTVSPAYKYLHFSTTSHMFAPLPIGNITHPVQMYPLYNDGGQSVQFHLDLQPLDDIQQKNCGWRVFECRNSSGKIAPGENVYVSWIFSPLEAKTYTVDVLIHIIGGESTLVTFTGMGYDPAIMGSTMVLSDQANDSLPKKQLIPIADQLLYLSEERISFDNVPVLTAKSRIILLRNVSKYALSFRWMLANSPADEVVSIFPSEGYIKPFECMMCKVTFYSNDPPAIYNLDCVCEVTNETLMWKYNKQISDWYDKQEEKKMLFTLSESDIEHRNAENRPGSVPHKLKSIRMSTKMHMSEPDLQRYEALPPISSEQKGPRKENVVVEIGPRPQPAEMFTVHLGITARTYTIAEFYSNFTDNIGKHFIRSASSTKINLILNDKKKSHQCTKEEFCVVSMTLTVLLKDLIEGKDFEELVTKTQQEPVPYFGMLADVEDDSQTKDNVVPHLKTPNEAILPQLDWRNDTIRYAENTIQDQSPNNIGRKEINGASSNVSAKQDQSNPIVEEEAWLDNPLLGSNKGSSALKARQLLKRSSELHTLLDKIFEDTLFNLLSEASNKEISLTARPRLVALPPSGKGTQKSTVI